MRTNQSGLANAGVWPFGNLKSLWPLLLAGFSCFAHSAGRVCPTDNLDPARCGPVTTKIALANGTVAFFDIPANPTLGTSAVNAAYFSPDGFDLEGNGGSTVAAYTGSLMIKSVVPVNGGVDTLFANGSVYFSPNGQNLGGAARARSARQSFTAAPRCPLSRLSLQAGELMPYSGPVEESNSPTSVQTVSILVGAEILSRSTVGVYR